VKILAILGICWGAYMLTACTEDDTQYYPDIYFADIPDFPQQNPDSAFEAGGVTYCAPVAVSNSLVWLEGNTDRDYQHLLIKKLASQTYMSTSPYSGTSPSGVLHGVAQYFDEIGQQYQRLEYAGWKSVQSRYQAQLPLSKEWLIEGLGSRSAVWLNLGWYETPIPGYYHRVSGHWVVLVGYRQGRFLIHDPGPWAGSGIDPQSLVIQEAQPLLLRSEQDFLIPAPPIIELKKARSPNGERAFIDGAIILALPLATS